MNIMRIGGADPESLDRRFPKTVPESRASSHLPFISGMPNKAIACMHRTLAPLPGKLSGDHNVLSPVTEP